MGMMGHDPKWGNERPKIGKWTVLEAILMFSFDFEISIQYIEKAEVQ